MLYIILKLFFVVYKMSYMYFSYSLWNLNSEFSFLMLAEALLLHV